MSAGQAAPSPCLLVCGGGAAHDAGEDPADLADQERKIAYRAGFVDGLAQVLAFMDGDDA